MSDEPMAPQVNILASIDLSVGIGFWVAHGAFGFLFNA
jgi:hypothetical protein